MTSDDRDTPTGRPIFGVDRLPPDQATAAPAWRGESDAERVARWRRELMAWARKRAPQPEPEEEPEP